MNGVIVVDKPGGWTSHDVVARMRRLLGQRSVGHLGTLDPLATGVLPLVVGSFTRLAQFYTASDKTYEAVIRLGFSTTTYDADGDPVQAPVGTAAPGCPSGRRPDLSLGEIKSLATQFVGLIEQTPPPFSAKKIHGVPAYKLARQKKAVDLKPVQVEIKEFSILSLENERVHCRARVSSGTYMRSIAHELGQRLGCGAHLESLRRTAVAEFDMAQAHTLEEIEVASGKILGAKARGCYPEPVRSKGCHSEPVRSGGEEPASQEEHEGSDAEGRELLSLFIHPRQLLPQLPSVTADDSTVARIRNGRTVNLPELSRAREVKVFANQTDLIAIATRVAGSLFHPKIVFPPAPENPVKPPSCQLYN